MGKGAEECARAMKSLVRPSRVVAVVCVLVLAVWCAGCAGSTAEPAGGSEATGGAGTSDVQEPTDEPAATSAPTGTGEPVSTGGSAVTLYEGTPLLYFVDTDEVAKLRQDMDAGLIPTSCNVLYDQMGSRPDVTVTDPDVIREIYRLVQQINVPAEGTAWSVTDSYHHVYFTLQDGTKVGFNFEGAGSLYWDGHNWPTVGDGALWAYVQELQDGTAGGAASLEESVYTIVVEESEEGLVTSCPNTARAGELVTVKTVGVADAELTVKVDGIRLPSSDGMGMEFQFWMPDRDVTVTVSCRVYPGGA